MRLIRKIIIKALGKNTGEQIDKLEISKAKLTAIVGVLIVAVETLSPAWGHPVIIPKEIKEFLIAAGLWSVRDALK